MPNWIRVTKPGSAERRIPRRELTDAIQQGWAPVWDQSLETLSTHVATLQEAVVDLAGDVAAGAPPVGGDSAPGVNGKSAYELAVDNGFVGTVQQWLASLEGPPGADSTVPGPPGDTGPEGPQGLPGVPGTTDYLLLTNRPSLATVASSGAYGDLSGRPTLGTASTHAHEDYALAGHTHPGGSGPVTVKLAADHAPFTSTGLANVTGLSFAVTAGTLYRFTFFIAYRTAATTTGARFGVTLPAVTTFAATTRLAGFAADGTDSEFTGALTTSGDSAMSTAVAAASTDYLAVVEGVLLPSANGTLQLQAATEVNASAVTVRNGSHGQLWTI